MFTTYPILKDSVFIMNSNEEVIFKNNNEKENWLDIIDNNNNIGYDFTNDEHKIIINYKNHFGHCLHDTLAIILYEHKYNKNSLILINASQLYDNPLNTFLFNLLDNIKINYKIINLKKVDLKIKNFKYWKSVPVLYESLKEIDASFKNFYSEVKPFRKVFLSRSRVSIKPESALTDNIENNWMFGKGDSRLDNEELLESYFSSLGFEIISPETFKTFEDQLLFFSQTKTLIGVTGAGLWNALFMHDESKMIELTTPLLTQGIEFVQNYYKCLAFVKNHTYLSITNMRNSSDIISNIEKDRLLKEYIFE